MGKKQHQKDKMYLTPTEWREHYGGKKQTVHHRFKKLPFDCCSLSFQPFKTPVCTKDGYVFDIQNIIPFVKKYKAHPGTGKPLKVKDLFKLTFHKNADGKFHCPVTYKVFNEHSHIVAIKASSHVYSYDAVRDFNVKLKNWNDLLTETSFTKEDIITIQDPSKPEAKMLDNFDHVKKDFDMVALKGGGAGGINVQSQALQRVFKEMSDKDVSGATIDPGKKTASGSTAPASTATTTSAASGKGAAAAVQPSKDSMYTTYHMASSFTSSVMEPTTKQTRLAAPEDPRVQGKITPRRVHDKGYVRLVTNCGAINLEIYCPSVPLASENFLTLCARGYYDNTKFHRVIRNFMMQGGDPTGTGRGGESMWKKKFRDEIRPQLSHTGGGILSMANSGSNSNGSQFFITFKSAPHLDGKHTIFGRVVGGMEVVQTVERLPTDDKDHPKEPVRILETQVFVNPFDAEYAKQKEAEKKKGLQKKRGARSLVPYGADDDDDDDNLSKDDASNSGLHHWYSNPSGAGMGDGLKASTAIGKYLPQAQSEPAKKEAPPGAGSNTGAAQPLAKKRKAGTGGFGDFSSW